MKRTFLAIKIPVSKQMIEFIQDIKFVLKDERIKWVENWNLHITLFFIGDIDESIIDEISNKLTDNLGEIKSFNLICKGVGVFKNIYNPKVLWFGIKQSENLINLKLAVDKVISSFGFIIEERDFKPHLTIGRVKLVKNNEKFKNALEKYKEVEIQNFSIKEVIFYESKLTLKGPVYNVLKKFPLI
ncbi:MAG: RNA 2',3'-cyclic phosphodiesterase [Bacteroidales bacterium]|nr:RNA 2',3'-cyclic phosphodiesterase [Bacteroidales bacterium]